MSKPKSPSAPPAPVSMPGVVVVASIKGGVGKTLLASVVADCATLAGQTLTVFQVDDQRRLEALLGARVQTIAPDLDAVMRSPKALTAPFAPLYTACLAAAAGGPAILLDVGANRVENTTLWMQKVELAEDLREWELPVLILVPALVEAEALRQAAATIQAFEIALPAATIAFVENQRDGSVADLKPRSEAAQVLRNELMPLLGARHHLVMPCIEADAWAPFEAHNLRLIKAMTMAPAVAAELLGEEVADAKIMRSAITAFLQHMRAELSQVLAFSTEARDG